MKRQVVKNKFQQYVINAILMYLNCCLKNNVEIEIFESHGAKYAIRNGFITHYASMYQISENEFVNLWQNVYSKTGKNKNISFCRCLLMSEAAYNLLNSIEDQIKAGEITSAYSYRRKIYEKYSKNTNSKILKKESKELLYWEHITPNSVVFKEISDLYKKHKNNDTEIEDTDVKECFKNHKIVLLTKYEASILDKKYRSKGTAFERIKYLYEQENFRLCLKGKMFKKSDSLGKDDFIGDVKKYFDSDDFIIDVKKEKDK